MIDADISHKKTHKKTYEYQDFLKTGKHPIPFTLFNASRWLLMPIMMR